MTTLKPNKSIEGLMIQTLSNNDVAALKDREKERSIMMQKEGKGCQIVSLPKVNFTKASENPLWDFKTLSLPYLWTHYGVQGEGVNVYVIDTGIDSKHPSFAHYSRTPHGIGSLSFLSGVQSPADENGHGTWVCGKLAGQGIGIAPKCNLHSLRVLDGSGTGTSEFTNKALEWILNNSETPHVINLSLGSSQKNAKQEKLIWQLYKKGAIIVVAAGNSGSNDQFYPACYDGVLAISAVDKNQDKAVFSNYGGKVALSAPGVQCYSSYLHDSFMCLDGTSMASPIVAGLVVLGVCFAMNRGMKDCKQIRDLVVKTLEASASDLGQKGRDPFFGYGLINGTDFMEKLDKSLIP